MWLFFNLCRSDHVSDALISLRLRVAERIHCCTPSYLGPFTYVVDLPSRRGLRSSCSDDLISPPVQRCTIGSRAFSVAGPQLWNCRQWSLRRRHLWRPSTLDSTFLFTDSFPDIRLIWHLLYTLSIVDPVLFLIEWKVDCGTEHWAMDLTHLAENGKATQNSCLNVHPHQQTGVKNPWLIDSVFH